MTIRTNAELTAILNSASTQYEQVRLLDAALTEIKRIKAKRVDTSNAAQKDVWENGTLFRDAALLGEFTINDVEITGYGITSDLTTCLAADLTTGTSVLRIEGGGHWIEGTLGLLGASTDFVVPENPTAVNSIAIANTFRINPNSALPEGIPDRTPPIVTVVTDVTTVSTARDITITAIPEDPSDVAKIDFFRNGVKIGTRTVAPWSITHPVTTFENGVRHYYTKAYDALENMAESAPASVTVSIPYPVEVGSAIAVGSTITTLSAENTSANALTNVPITFGQVFKLGDLPGSGAYVELRTSDNTIVPCQFDSRATHPDGSIRHAVISAIIPSMAANQKINYNIVRKTQSGTVTPATVSEFSGLSAEVIINDAGTTYSISLSTLLAGTKTTWLNGNVVSEWEVVGTPKTAAGVEHEYLSIRFNVRGYKGQNKARVDIAVENTWAMIAAKEFAYDVTMTVGGNVMYTKSNLLHFADTRYRKVFWWNASEPTVHLAHNIDYLIASKAIPNYDRTIVPARSAINYHKNNVTTRGEPMGNGALAGYMPATAARPEIGILPGHAVLYLLSMDKDAKDTTLAQGNLAGSWGMHVRDKDTGRVVSLTNRPTYPTGRPNSINTGSTSRGSNSNVADKAHHVDQAFVPYVVTGDIYYLEEMHFWSMYCAWSQDTNRRSQAKGIWRSDQIRGQGWCFRSLAHAAWISPPSAAKTELEFILQSNLDWFNARYTNTNELIGRIGAITHNLVDDYYGYGTFGAQNAIALWMDDYVTCSVGRMVELGFTNATSFFAQKAKFTTARLYGVEGVCWIQAAAFCMRMRPGGNSTPFYTSYREVYENTMSPAVIAAAKNSNCATQEMADAWTAYNAWAKTADGPYMDGVSNPYVGDMDGYSDSPTGYPSCMQAAVAYCATHKVHNGVHAWEVFDGRSIKPSYNTNPQFAIVPRN